MKLFSVYGLLGLFVFVGPVFLSEAASASKMQPGMMSQKLRFGMNANATCRRPRFNICQACHINIRMKVKKDTACVMDFKSLGPFAGQEIVVRHAGQEAGRAFVDHQHQSGRRRASLPDV